MKTSLKGAINIAASEGIVLTPYLDSVDVWTIGIGHTSGAGRSPHDIGKLTIDSAIELFRTDLAKYERRVDAAFDRPITQSQFDAAVSFDYNTGAINRATWVKNFNSFDDDRARVNFMQWRKPSEIIPRREDERDLFFDGVYPNRTTGVVYPVRNRRPDWRNGKRVDLVAALEDQFPVQALVKDSAKPMIKSKTAWGTGILGSLTGLLGVLDDPWMKGAVLGAAFLIVAFLLLRRKGRTDLGRRADPQLLDDFL